MKADLALIDLSDFAYQPFNSAARQMVYSESGRAVHTVMVDGEIVLANGEPTKCQHDGVSRRTDRGHGAGGQRLSLRSRNASPPLTPYLLEATRNLNNADLGLNRFSGTILTSDKS